MMNSKEDAAPNGAWSDAGSVAINISRRPALEHQLLEKMKSGPVFKFNSDFSVV